MSEVVLENELPKGWTFSKIDSICDVKGRVGWKGYKKSDLRNEGYYVIGATHLDSNFKLDLSKPVFISKEKFLESPEIQISKGDILIAQRGSIGKTAIVDQEISATVNPNTMLLKNILIDNFFLSYLLSSPKYQEQIISSNNSSTIPMITQKFIKNLEINIPPLNEQKRIVEKIDEFFLTIEFLKQTLEDSKIKLNLYRRSLLKKIFDNVSNFVEFSSIAHINPKPERGEFSDELDVSFIPMKNVEAITGKIDTSISQKFKKVKKGYTFFKDGDLLFAKITPCMENGKIAIATGLINKIGFGSTEFHVIRLKDKNNLPKFYFWYLIQDDFRHIAQRNMTGTAGQLRVPTDYIKNIFVPNTTKENQNKIVTEIEYNVNKIIKQNELVENILIILNSLKKTILKQAFEGKLVPQDPNDEPAEILLQKIMQEKKQYEEKIKREKQQLKQKQKTSRSKKNVK